MRKLHCQKENIWRASHLDKHKRIYVNHRIVCTRIVKPKFSITRMPIRVWHTNFFEENIMTIMNGVVASETNMSDIETPTQRIFENLMTDICATTMCEVQNIIQESKPKLSCLDPLPVPLLKSILPAHIQILIHPINTSFYSGTQESVITLQLKKPGWKTTAQFQVFHL